MVTYVYNHIRCVDRPDALQMADARPNVHYSFC